MFKWKVETNEIKSLVWDSNFNKLLRTQFSIAFTDKQEIEYIKDRQILRIDKVKDTSIQPQNKQNTLFGLGKQGQNNQKIGRWQATWKGEILDNGGGEYAYGKKSGQWKDLTQNYWSKAQVYEIGKYDNDIRKGVWEFVYQKENGLIYLKFFLICLSYLQW
ncbi:unnamed protein product [Paramecium sonneborni]|uniref:MORN repeat protein n=1 Tax=Paramecium sonneborni TaxID=65129 RepID=A0A8S1PD55_9CILI|nr:unnamed protein product [Paramecium sonneborni]